METCRKLVAEVPDDLVAERLDLGPHSGLVENRRARGAPAVIAGPQNSGVFRYAGYEPIGGFVNSPSSPFESVVGCG
jgi:hypothetical protein